MSIVHMATDSVVERVNFNFFTATWVEMVGDRARVTHVLAPSLTSNEPAILVTGVDCEVEDVRVSANSGPSCIEVTGDRAYLRQIRSTSSTDAAAVRFNTSADSVLDTLYSTLDEHGLIVLDSARCRATNIRINQSDLDGVVWDGSDDGIFEGTVNLAGQHGFHFTDSSRCRWEGIIRDAGRDTTNTYDGVLGDGDSNNNRTSFTVSYSSGNQMRYGLNLSVATIDTHIEASKLTGSGATGAYNNAGTGTVATDDHIV